MISHLLLKYLQTNNLFSDRQYRFPTACSTSNQLALLSHSKQSIQQIDENKIELLNISEAFDITVYAGYTAIKTYCS